MKATINYNQTNWVITVPELNINFVRETAKEAIQFCRLNELAYTIID